MENQNKWNKELFYSLIFFVTAIMWFFFNPFAEIRDFIDSLPNALDIKSKLFDLGIFPIFYNVVNIMKVGFYFFLLCSIYAGIKSWRKSLKTLSILFISLIFLTPQTVSAVWWNPGTWWKKDVSQEELKQDIVKEKPNVVKQEKKPIINTSSKNKETLKVELPAQTSNLQSELQMVKGEIENKNTEINSLKKTLAELQKNLAQENPQCKQIVIEKVVYKDRVIEKPTEKIVFQDKIIEKLVEKIVYQDRIVENPVEKKVYSDKLIQGSCDIPVTSIPVPSPAPTQTSPIDPTPIQNEIYPVFKKYSDTNGGCRNQSGYNKLFDLSSSAGAICTYSGGNIKVGQQIKIETSAIPSKNSSVILYKFDATEGGGSKRIKDWSEENSVEYIVPNIPYSWVGFTVAVKNDYPTRREGNYDDYIQIRYDVIP